MSEHAEIILSPLTPENNFKKLKKEFVYSQHQLWAFMEKNSPMSIRGFCYHMADVYPFFHYEDAADILCERLDLIKAFGGNYGIIKSTKNMASSWYRCRILNEIYDDAKGVKIAEEIGERPLDEYKNKDDILQPLYCKAYCGAFMEAVAKKDGFEWELKPGWTHTEPPGECILTARAGPTRIVKDGTATLIPDAGPVGKLVAQLRAMYAGDHNCAYYYMKRNNVDPLKYHEWLIDTLPPLPEGLDTGKIMHYYLNWYRNYGGNYGIIKATKKESVCWLKCGIPNTWMDKERNRKLSARHVRGLDEYDNTGKTEYVKYIHETPPPFCRYHCINYRKMQGNKSGYDINIEYGWPGECKLTVKN